MITVKDALNTKEKNYFWDCKKLKFLPKIYIHVLSVFKSFKNIRYSTIFTHAR